MLRWKAIEVVDILLGMLGFFAAALLAITGLLELSGRPALGCALVLLLLIAALVALFGVRRRMLRAEAHGGDPVSTAWGGSRAEYERRRHAD